MAALTIVDAEQNEELLRSQVFRLAVWNPEGMRRTMEAAFQRKWIIPDWLVPTAIDHFANGIGRSLHHPEPEYWIRNHTLAPYFAAPLPIEKRVLLYERMKNAAYGPRRLFLPLSTFDSHQPVPVLCDICDDRNRLELGFSIVCRSWMLPFATRCPVHGILLRQYPDWSPLDRGAPKPIPIISGQKIGGLDFLKGSLALLSSDLPQDEIRHLLRDRGFLGDSGNYIRWADLVPVVTRFVRGKFEHEELATLFSSEESVERLLLVHGRLSLHPVTTIVLRAALEATPSVMQLQAAAVSRPVTKEQIEGAFLRSSTVKEAAIRAGISISTAGVWARRLEVPYRKDKQQARYKLLKAAVEGLLKAGLDISVIAETCRVSKNFVYKVLQSNAPLGELRSRRRESVELASCRLRWTECLASHPGKGARFLRQTYRALFDWLYKHDREWLKETLRCSRPAPRDTLVRSVRHTKKADEQLANAVIEAAVKLSAQALTARRRSVTQLLRQAGRARRGHLDLETWPATAFALEQLLESSYTQVLRCLESAAGKLRESGAEVANWRLAKHSGLRGSTIDSAGVDLDELIGQLGREV